MIHSRANVQPIHIGFVKQGSTLIVQCASDVDLLSCELWKYYGQRLITPVELINRLPMLLAEVNRQFSKAFDHIELEDKDSEEVYA